MADGEKLPPRIKLPLLDMAAESLEREGSFSVELDSAQTAAVMREVLTQVVKQNIPLSQVEQSMDVTIGDTGAAFDGHAQVFVGVGPARGEVARIGLAFAFENDPQATRDHDGLGQIKLAGMGEDQRPGAVTFTEFWLSDTATSVLAKKGGSADSVKGLVVNKLRDPNQSFLDVFRGQMAVRGKSLATMGLSFGRSTEGKAVLQVRATGGRAPGR